MHLITSWLEQENDGEKKERQEKQQTEEDRRDGRAPVTQTPACLSIVICVPAAQKQSGAAQIYL